MSVQIIVDSAADFEEESIRRYGLMVVPLKTIFSDGEYVEGETITRAEFYQKLKETGRSPKPARRHPMTLSRSTKRCWTPGTRRWSLQFPVSYPVRLRAPG